MYKLKDKKNNRFCGLCHSPALGCIFFIFHLLLVHPVYRAYAHECIGIQKRRSIPLIGKLCAFLLQLFYEIEYLCREIGCIDKRIYELINTRATYLFSTGATTSNWINSEINSESVCQPVTNNK